MISLPNPTDVDAVRAWLAARLPDVPAVHMWLADLPDVAAVRMWSRRLLADVDSVPALGSPAWLSLSDQDPRKLAAAIPPAVAHLTAATPAAIADRLRHELDEFATAWRRALKETSADV